MAALLHRLNSALGRILPERRLHLKTDSATRILHLKPMTQLGLMGGTAILMGWTILSGALLVQDRIGASGTGHAVQAQSTYESRLAALADERDARAEEAREAQMRFAVALDQVARYQSDLLNVQKQNHELEAGLDAIQQKLGSAVSAHANEAPAGEVDLALNALNEQLRATAEARDEATATARLAQAEAALARAEQEQVMARNQELFAQIEDAATAAALPYRDMFAQLGLNTDALLSAVDADYAGVGGPLTPATVSTSGNAAITQSEARAKEIIVSLDQVNRYRIAADKLPLDMPVKSAFRYTSGFGQRWGRAHQGVDLAAPVGTPIVAPGEGVVTFAGWQRGYGNLIKIEHALGTETRYGHLSKIRVKVGQKVSRGALIGDMGNTGRSTGPHLHYEVRVNGAAVNPMKFIKAAQNVF
ncbi:DUF5930 domain-containing protein [Paracoccus jeotgali]|uniref:Peptidase M23 n=1 Tax=Paracoccus jeotgali TaxID=2065379 RepID=A0A2K9MFX1_9RHOB|nr:DUF5930 domain-containing protein [Paracoccus jeotgali]AUM74392.1 peptidase M23 [Paracoccus jeotgali]